VLANSISLFGAALCVLSGILAARHTSLQMVAITFLIGSLCDAIDGKVARRNPNHQPQQDTGLGGFLDTFLDKVGEVGLCIGLAFWASNIATARIMMCAACTGLLCSFTKSAATEMGLHVAWKETKILGRVMRVAILTVGAFIAGESQNTEHAIFLLGVVLTIWNSLMIIARVFRAYQGAKQSYVKIDK
jgi:phosphatidylglycerophosphate synthase